MRFTFEESELLNSFIEQNPNIISKSDFLSKFNLLYCDDDSLKNTKASAALKVNSFDAETYNKFINDMPIDSFSNY